MHPEHDQALYRWSPRQAGWITLMFALAAILAGAAILPLAVSAAPQAGRPDTHEVAPPVLRSAPAAPLQQASTITPSLTVTKTTNGVYAPVSPGPILAKNAPVTWRYSISNTGSVAITLTVVDNVEGNLEGICSSLSSQLEPGAGITCVISDGVASLGQYVNLVTVTGTNALNPDLSTVVTDVSHYFGGSIGITMTKYTNGVDVATPTGLYLRQGDPVTWTYHITNTGNVTLTLALTDVGTSGVPGAITCTPTALTGELAPYTNTLCTMAGTVQTGAYTNTATVTGTSTISSSWQSTASDASYYFGATTSVTLTKYTNGVDVATPTGLYLRVGEPVTWTYRITNTSNVTLTLALTDVSTSGVRGVSNCAPSGVLAPNANTLCTLTGAVQENQYSNTATVTGTTTVGAGWQTTSSDNSYYFGIRPQVTISKTTNGAGSTQPPGLYVAFGDSVTWVYTLQNTGNVTLTSLSLIDDPEGTIANCTPYALANGLAPAQFTVCTQPGGAAQAGQYTNTATITGTSALGGFTPITGSVKSFYFGVTAGISLTKYTNGQVVASPTALYLRVGDPVTWTYRITNTSNVALGNLSLTDDRLPGGIPGCAQTLNGGLAAGASALCTATGTVQAGAFTNTATVTGTTALGTLRTVNASASSYYYGVTPGLALTKYTNGVEVAAAPGLYLTAGDTVVWTYRITNTGNAALANLVLTDDRVGAITGCTPALASGLAAGASALCTASGTVQAGQYANTATVTGTTASGVPQVASDSSYYFGVTRGITLTKYTNGALALTPPGPYLTVGASVVWTYRITNTGNVALTNLTLSDDPQGDIATCTPALGDGLAPAASTLCTASGAVQAGQYVNTATASATAAQGAPQSVLATAVSHYFGVATGAAVSKQVAPASVDAGEVVTYTLVVTGPAAAQPVTLALTDTLPAALVLETGSASATLGEVRIDAAGNRLYWTYTATPGRSDVVTITYRARLATQCATALTNTVQLAVDAVVTAQAQAVVTLRSALKCDLYLPIALKPVEPLPALANGNFDVEPKGTNWTQLVNGGVSGLIYANGAPFAALSAPYYAWLGGARNQTNQLRQSMTTALPASYAATLQFCYRLESAEPAAGNDYVEVRAGEKTTPDAADNRQRIDLYAGAVTPGQQWRRAAVSLDALKGKTVTIEFFSSLNGSLNSNFLVDNVKLCVLAAVPGSNAPVCATEEFCSAATTAAGEEILEVESSNNDGIEKVTPIPHVLEDSASADHPVTDPGMDDMQMDNGQPLVTAALLPTLTPPDMVTPTLETIDAMEQ